MAHYQLRRPSPIKVIARKKRIQARNALFPRQEEEEDEEEGGPESPDSPESSPSSAGSGSSSSDSDSDDDDNEPPSATKTEETPASSQIPAPSILPSGSASSPSESLPASGAIPSPSPSLSPPDFGSSPAPALPPNMAPPKPSQSLSPTLSSQSSAATSSPSSFAASSPATSSRTASSRTAPSQTSAAALPQITNNPSILSTVILPSSTGSTAVFSSKLARPTQPDSQPDSDPSVLPSGVSRAPVGAENDPPREAEPEAEPTLMSKGAQAAAITLSIFGALALVVAALLFYKRRKRLRSQKGHAENAFNPDNAGSLRAPEVVHVDDNSRYGGGHLTRSTERSNTLFGAGPYIRPETVSSNSSRSRVTQAQPTPNPFADPPLNKAYDVLAGRPRSTTLTDRGSWVKNPFKNPESERFDPFGELQAKARMERIKYMEQARNEAERQRQFEEKERMGLIPDDVLPLRRP